VVLEKLVEDLAKMTVIRKRAEDAEKALKSELDKHELADGEYPSTTGKYILKVITKQSWILIPEKVAKILDKKDAFMKVIKVVKKELEKYMTLSDIDKCSEEGKATRAYTTEEKKK
jgi:Fe-S cluster biosynthesis and repair protein YggX